MICKKLQEVLEGDYRAIPLRGGKVAIVDPDDYDLLSPHKWFAKRRGKRFYACRKVKSGGTERLIWMHRVITHCPQGYVVHHKNRLSLDNRKTNLAILTPQQHDAIYKNFLDTP